MSLNDPGDVVTWSELYDLVGQYLACGCWIILLLLIGITAFSGWLWTLLYR
jgi:hypothetical protein